MSTAASLKPSVVITPSARPVVVKKAEAAEETKFAKIEANTFFKIMFSPTTPEAQRAALAAALTFTTDKIANREHIKEFELFKEYLSAERENMAKKIIQMTDTGAFSELQLVYGGLNNDLLAFDKAMSPLQNILDAVRELRGSGKIYDTFQEIQNDKEREKERQTQRAAATSEIETIEARVREINHKIATEGENRSFLGYGGVKQSSRETIARMESDLRSEQAKIAALRGRVEEIAREETAASQGEDAENKKKLRELTDITSEEHKDRQKQVVDTALNFCKTAGERVGSVRQHLDLMGNQIDNLGDANGQMNMIYAIMTEGIKDAHDANIKQREDLSKPAANEDAMKRMQRETATSDIESHITLLDESARDTITTAADLTSQSIRIKTMADASATQKRQARTLQTQGVAGVADRLSVVLQAVSAAALGESSALARDTMLRMSDNTNKIAKSETIRVAMGIDVANAEVMRAIEDLGSYGETMRQATEYSLKGVSEMQENLKKLQELAKDTSDAVRDNIGVNADVGSGASAQAPASKPAEVVRSPFGLGKVA